MIIKGNARAGAKSLANHLLRADTNEHVEVQEISGTVAEDLLGALKEMEAVAGCSRTGKPFYHASINTPVAERLTPQQRAHAIDRLERELALTGQPRAIVVHQKEGREHCHIVWSRVDVEHGRAIRMDHNFRKHELVARELEREFGHERVQGAHIERDDKQRPPRTPGHDEMQQGARTGWKPKDARALITQLWRSTDSGQAFEAALAENGWLLAKGDRRDFVVVDPQGGIHSLARRIEGASAKDVRARMEDIKNLPMPTTQEARAVQRKIADLEQLLEDDKPARPPVAASPEHWTDHAGMAQQQRSALAWSNATRRNDVPASSPASPSAAKPAEERIKRFEDLYPPTPGKDFDRDR